MSPDGRRFLRVQQAVPDSAMDRIDVVLDWTVELKRLVATK